MLSGVHDSVIIWNKQAVEGGGGHHGGVLQAWGWALPRLHRPVSSSSLGSLKAKMGAPLWQLYSFCCGDVWLWPGWCCHLGVVCGP